MFGVLKIFSELKGDRICACICNACMLSTAVLCCTLFFFFKLVTFANIGMVKPDTYRLPLVIKVPLLKSIFKVVNDCVINMPLALYM